MLSTRHKRKEREMFSLVDAAKGNDMPQEPLPNVELGALDPVDEQVEIEYQNSIKANRAELDKKVTQLTAKLHQLRKRILYRDSISQFDQALGMLGLGEPTSIPSTEELKDFIELVRIESEKDYGPDIDVHSEFEGLLEHTTVLTYALMIAYRLELVDLDLAASPFKDLLAKQEAILDIKTRFAESKEFFADLGFINHPLNQTVLRLILLRLERDLKFLLSLEGKIIDYKNKLAAITCEADLPDLAELDQLKEQIDDELGRHDSPCHTGALKEILEIKKSINQIKQEKHNQAQDVFKGFQDKFDGWQKTVMTLYQQLSHDKTPGFPWKKYPPSQREVDDFYFELEQAKQSYEQWPCVHHLFPQYEFKLAHYQRILSTMKSVTERELEKAFKDKYFTAQNIQSYIEAYKFLLEEGGYEDADQQVSNMGLRLFKFAHEQNRRAQWFSFFRRSYFDNLPSLDWSDIVRNAFSMNLGYSGNRTREVLISLGWFENGRLTSLAPAQLLEKFEQLKQCDDYKPPEIGVTL